MNLYAGSTLSSMMRPLFWNRMTLFGSSIQYQRQLFLRKYTISKLKSFLSLQSAYFVFRC